MSSSSIAVPPRTQGNAPKAISPVTVWLLWHFVILILGVVRVVFQSAPLPIELVRGADHSANRVEQVVVNVWYQWDTAYFVRIAEHGYRADDGTALFHPLFPLTGRLVGRLIGRSVLLGLFIVA